MPRDSVKDRLNVEIRAAQQFANGEFTFLGELGLSAEQRKERRQAQKAEREKTLATAVGRAIEAVSATTLTKEADFDGSVAEAFKAFALDPNDPADWRVLLWRLARVHFAPKAKGGRPKSWTDKRYCRLLRDVADKQRGNSRLSKEDAYRLLANSAEYRGISARGIKAAYQKACNPEINDALAEIAQMLFRKFGAERTSAIMAEDEALTRPQAEWKALQGFIETCILYLSENNPGH